MSVTKGAKMNFGLLMLGLLLVSGVSLGFVAIAGAPHASYIDSYGNTTTQATNMTQGNLTGAVAPLSDASGGLIILFGFFVVVGAVVFLASAVKDGQYGQGRR